MTVGGVVMYLELVSVVAKHFTGDLETALAVIGRLESAELRPNVVRSGPNYAVYIANVLSQRPWNREVNGGGWS